MECLSKSCLVIQLVSGLTSAYRGVGTLIQPSDHQPPFYQAQSMLTLEEARSAMVAASQFIYDSNFSHSDQQQRGKPSGYHKNYEKKKLVMVVLGPVRDSLSVRVRRPLILTANV
ncbi:hypothetical protein HKD37_06G016836 [Glycine soja]